MSDFGGSFSSTLDSAQNTPAPISRRRRRMPNSRPPTIVRRIPPCLPDAVRPRRRPPRRLARVEPARGVRAGRCDGRGGAHGGGSEERRAAPRSQRGTDECAGSSVFALSGQHASGPKPAPGRARFTGRNTYPSATPAAEVHASVATFTQVGIGIVRTRPCFPTRSTMHHRPSRCWT